MIEFEGSELATLRGENEYFRQQLIDLLDAYEGFRVVLEHAKQHFLERT